MSLRRALMSGGSTAQQAVATSTVAVMFTVRQKQPSKKRAAPPCACSARAASKTPVPRLRQVALHARLDDVERVAHNAADEAAEDRAAHRRPGSPTLPRSVIEHRAGATPSMPPT